MAEDFTWRDGERLIRFAAGAAGQTPVLLAQNGFDGFVLVTSERAERTLPELTRQTVATLRVPAGKVDEISAELLGELRRLGLLEDVAGEGLPSGPPLVALGGGRVVDTAKAIAGATRARSAAIPTTLSGAEMTPFHRLPAGATGARMGRPALVVADPALMASAPVTRLAASAMNALAHAMEALYTPLSGPVTDLAALRAVSLLAEGTTSDPPDRERLALGALLAGYASGATDIAVHHALSQAIVRTAGTPHAETNAVMLPHSARLMSARAPGALSELAKALGDPSGDPEAAAAGLARIAARSGHTRLATLGVTEEHLPAVASTVLEHRALPNTPDPPGEAELLKLLRGAL